MLCRQQQQAGPSRGHARHLFLDDGEFLVHQLEAVVVP